ncbi:MAG: esterase [Alphaproteobacteria bacterium]|nr:esterase [Alphaproteobacteria bacterium]
MVWRLIVLALVAWAAVSSAQAAPVCAEIPTVRTLSPGLGTTCRAVEHDGVERTFRLYVPNPVAGRQSLAVVIVLHGGGGAGIGMVALTRAALHRLADRDGVLVVYPDARFHHWNDGRDDFASPSHQANVDDVGFITRLTETLAGEFPVDRARIFVTGASNGGMMAIRLACERAERFAAVAPVMASMPTALAGTCRPAAPLPFLMINGSEDRLVPYDGGAVIQQRGTVIGVEATAKLFARSNRCLEIPVKTLLPDRDPNDETRIARLEWLGCQAAVLLYTVDGGGHAWPGGLPYASRALIGRTNNNLDASEEIWAFFAQRRR